MMVFLWDVLEVNLDVHGEYVNVVHGGDPGSRLLGHELLVD